MKTKDYILIGMGVVLASCSTDKAITKISFDNASKKATYYDSSDAVVPQNEAYVVEGGAVSVDVSNYNPLNTTFTVQQDADVLFFVSGAGNQPTTLLNYVGQAGGTAGGGGAAPLGALSAECVQTAKVNTEESNLLTLIQSINAFYTKVSAFNSRFAMYKSMPAINRDYFYYDLDVYIDDIKTAYLNPGITTGNAQGPDYIFMNGSEGNAILAEKANYTQQLQQQVAIVTKELAVLKKMAAACTTAGSTLSTTLDQTLAGATLLINDINARLAAMADTAANNITLAASLQFTDNKGDFIVGNTDELVLKMSVKDAANNITIFPLAKVPVVKHIKIDYSAGIFFSGLYDESHTKTMETTVDDGTDPPTSTNNYTLHKNDGGGLSYGAMGFVNFHTQYNQGVNFGASLGAGLMFNDDTKVVIAPTVDLLFGRYQRLILHAGVAFSKVDRVYSKYGDATFTDADYTPEIKDIVKGSFIFSISWNLTRQ